MVSFALRCLSGGIRRRHRTGNRGEKSGRSATQIEPSDDQSMYRTVSEPATLVVAGIIPIDLISREKKEVYTGMSAADKKTQREEARARTMTRWQERWINDPRGRWTFKLINELSPWVHRTHGEVNFYLTQLLTAYGYFRTYLHKMGKVNSPAYMYCDALREDAHHVFFICERWKEQRKQLEETTGRIIPENLTQTMLISEERWEEIATFAENILRTKRAEENETCQ